MPEGLLRRGRLPRRLAPGDVVGNVAQECTQFIGVFAALLLGHLLLAAEQVAGHGSEVLHDRARIGTRLLALDGLLHVLKQLR
jgi:hypothetical protein